jgi:hypothetical protein
VTYGPALAEGCSLLDGPARVREKHQRREDPWYTTTSASALLCPVRQRARFLCLGPCYGKGDLLAEFK